MRVCRVPTLPASSSYNCRKMRCDPAAAASTLRSLRFVVRTRLGAARLAALENGEALPEPEPEPEQRAPKKSLQTAAAKLRTLRLLGMTPAEVAPPELVEQVPAKLGTVSAQKHRMILLDEIRDEFARVMGGQGEPDELNRLFEAARRFGCTNAFDEMVAEVDALESQLSEDLKEKLALRAAPGVHAAIKPFWDLLKLESAESESAKAKNKQKGRWTKVGSRLASETTAKVNYGGYKSLHIRIAKLLTEKRDWNEKTAEKQCRDDWLDDCARFSVDGPILAWFQKVKRVLSDRASAGVDALGFQALFDRCAGEDAAMDINEFIIAIRSGQAPGTSIHLAPGL